MPFLRLIVSMVFALTSSIALSGAPVVDAPLPVLNINERGELTMTDEDFSFVPWSSDTNPGKAHVVQYFGANLGDRDTFQPFTDLLQSSLEPGSFHVTTVLNLDAALWGTTGFVVSELEKNKRKHPLATMVLDDNGIGVTEWELGKTGTGLVVLDAKGAVKYFSRQALSKEEMATALEIMRSSINSQALSAR